jgi:hypothetical protein
MLSVFAALKHELTLGNYKVGDRLTVYKVSTVCDMLQTFLLLLHSFAINLIALVV